MGEVFHAYEHDPSLRAAVLFGHGDRFSRGVDVDSAQASFQAGSAAPSATATVDILGTATSPPGKPVVCVVHGHTWNLGHEIYLACDVRIAAANTDFGQDETSHGRFPGGGATARFVREQDGGFSRGPARGGRGPAAEVPRAVGGSRAAPAWARDGYRASRPVRPRAKGSTPSRRAAPGATSRIKTIVIMLICSSRPALPCESAYSKSAPTAGTATAA